jgi:hypothetical protein
MPFFGGGGAAPANMVGATSSAAGTAGLVPAPAAGSQRKFLRGDATFQSISSNLAQITATRRSNGISFIGADATYNTRTTNSGFVLFAPLYIRETKTYTTFSVYVSSLGSASSVGKIAIYSISSSAAPDSLICESGTFATDSVGLKQPTMSSILVNDGWYYVAVATNSASNVGFYGNQQNFARGMISGTISGNPAIMIDYSTKAYADLWPSTWNGSDTYTSANHFICELT